MVKYLVLLLATGNIGFWLYLQRDLPDRIDSGDARRQQSTLDTKVVAPLVLEREIILEQGMIDRVVVNIVAAPRVEDVPECLRLGPFKGLVEARDGQSLLEAPDVAVVLRAVDQPTGTEDYRVLIPPQKTAQEAFRRLRELQARKIDSYVITDGANANGISLGVFSTRGAAQNARIQLETRGYETVIVPMPRYHREYWLYSDDAPSIGAEVWNRIRDGAPEVTVSFSECDDDGDSG